MLDLEFPSSPSSNKYVGEDVWFYFETKNKRDQAIKIVNDRKISFTLEDIMIDDELD